MPVYAKMIITALLSITAVTIYIKLPCTLRKSCMIAMLLSSAGDVFMVNAPVTGPFSTYVGAGFFIAAHLVYGGGFYGEMKKADTVIINPSFFTGLAIMLLSAAGLGVAEFAGSTGKKPVLFVLILVYIAAIGYNVCSMFSYAENKKGLTFLLPPAVILFYITDVFIFLDMLEINGSLRQYVWWFYPIAQLVIILFNSPFKKEEAQCLQK